MAIGTVALGLGTAVMGQEQPSAGLLNDWLRSWDPVSKDYDLGGEFRLRFEDHHYQAIQGVPGAGDFRETTPIPDNTYWLFRTRLHVGYSFCDWSSIYVEGQDSYVEGDERIPTPDQNRFDFRLAYLDVGNAKRFPLTARIGRQELKYGDERLIGPLDWHNITRVFDAVKLRYENEDLWADGFVSHVVIPDNHNFDMGNEYDWFSGVYAGSKTLVAKTEAEAYFLARNASVDSPNLQATGHLVPLATPRDIYTVGTRLKSLPRAYGDWDYTLEGAYQFGRFKDTAMGPSLEHEAYAASLTVGYTFRKVPGTLRVSGEYSYASGDDDALDGKHKTFEQLFPTIHKFYGLMDFFAWQNMHSGRVGVSSKPHKQVEVAMDVHSFWLADDRDAFYRLNGTPRLTDGYGRFSEAGKYVGTELDLVVTYAPHPAVQVQIGAGRFFVGDYPSDSFSLAGVPGGSRDANWTYGQFRLRF